MFEYVQVSKATVFFSKETVMHILQEGGMGIWEGLT